LSSNDWSRDPQGQYAGWAVMQYCMCSWGCFRRAYWCAVMRRHVAPLYLQVICGPSPGPH